MTVRRTLLLAAAIAALAAPSAGAYGHLGEAVGSQVLPQHWRTLPIAITVDNGPTSILGRGHHRATTWNAVTTAQDPWGTPTWPAGDFNRATTGPRGATSTGDGQQEVIFDEDGTALRRSVSPRPRSTATARATE